MTNNKYFLEERTEKFGISLIMFVNNIKPSFCNKNILNQILRSGTSIGANYREANGAESKKDFTHKIALSKKEAKETEYWLKMLFTSNPETKEIGIPIYNELMELIKIFAKTHSTLKKQNKN